MVTFTLIPTPFAATAFAVHATGCRDLKGLATTFEHLVDAKTANDAVLAATVDLNGLVAPADFTVMPCCNLRRCAAAGRVRPDPNEC